MEVTKRARVCTAFSHQEPDRVPWDLTLSEPAASKLATFYREPRLLESDFRHQWLGNHCKTVEPSSGALFHGLIDEVEPGHWRDGWGVVRDTRGMYGEGEWGVPVNRVLPEPDLSSYDFPEPPPEEAYSHYADFIARNRQYFIIANEGHLFEVAWALRGMENFLMDLILNPRFVNELLERITGHYLDMIDRSLQYDVDAFTFGDDWGGQNLGLLMGPHHWRRFFKPRLARMFSRIRAAGKKVHLHSDGAITEIIPDLVEIGLDVYNPLQPEVMDIFQIKKDYGEDLAFHGGVGVQHLLPNGTPDQVRECVKRTKAEIGDGGGYLLSQAHPDGILGDTPVENIVALLDTVGMN